MIPPVKKGQRLNVGFVGGIVEEVNRLGRGNGSFMAGPNGAFADGAQVVMVYNAGSATLPALSPAWIKKSFDTTAPNLLNQRAMTVEAAPTSMKRTNGAVILVDSIAAGAVGRAYICGTCLAFLTTAARRWLTTFAGWEVVWEEGLDTGAPSTADHYAVVRYTGDYSFWARLKLKTLIADNRWKYDWEEVEFTGGSSDLTIAAPTSPRAGPFTDDVIGETGWAWNTTEFENDSSIAGSGWEDETIHTTVFVATTESGPIRFRTEAINPIGYTNKVGGSFKFPVVRLRPMIVPGSGHVAYLFAGWNTPQLSFAAGCSF